MSDHVKANSSARETETEAVEANAPANEGARTGRGEWDSPIDWPTPIEMIRVAIAATHAENDGQRDDAEVLWSRTRNAGDGDAIEIDPMDDLDAAPIVVIEEPLLVSRAFDSLPPESAHWSPAREDRGSAPALDVLAAPRTIAIGFARRTSDSDPFAMRVPDSAALGRGAFVPPRISVRAEPARAPKPSEISTLPPPPPPRPRPRRESISAAHSRTHEAFFVAIGFGVGCLCTSVALHGSLPDPSYANTSVARVASAPVRPRAASSVGPRCIARPFREIGVRKGSRRRRMRR